MNTSLTAFNRFKIGIESRMNLKEQLFNPNRYIFGIISIISFVSSHSIDLNNRTFIIVIEKNNEAKNHD